MGKKEKIKGLKAEMKETAVMVNGKKRLIDEAQERLDKKQSEKDTSPDEEKIIDEEEYSLIKQLKDLKQEYRAAFEKNRQTRMDAMKLEQDLQNSKLALVKAFEDSYEQRFGVQEKETMQKPEGDVFDPQEQFDMAQAERLETQHPDALAYHNAKKSVARTRRRN